MRFDGKVVLITGAGAGIGRAAAIEFSRRGAAVAVNCRTRVHGEAVVKALPGGRGLFVEGDVSDAQAAEALVARTAEHFGRIDVLVNNAGIVLPGTVENTSVQDWERTMAVNVRGVYLVSARVIPLMRANGGGVIVNVASSAAHKGVRDRAAYSASKGAVVALTRAMAMDLIADNIRVNCVSPGTTQSPSLEERLSRFSDPNKARLDFIARQPMGRLGRPEEIAQAIVFAACGEAAFMNGANLSIDGAMTC